MVSNKIHKRYVYVFTKAFPLTPSLVKLQEIFTHNLNIYKILDWNYDNYINKLESNCMIKNQQKTENVYTIYNTLKNSQVTRLRKR